MGPHGAASGARIVTTFSTRLCHLNELPDGDARGFDPEQSGQDRLFIVRRGPRLHAYLDACPHQGGTPMAWRRHAYLNAARDRIVCHAHGAQFDIESGHGTLGPCLGQALTRVALTIAHDGGVHLANPMALETPP